MWPLRVCDWVGLEEASRGGEMTEEQKERGLSGLKPSHMWTLRLYRLAGLWVGMQVCTVSLDKRKFRRWLWDGDLRWPVSHSGVRNTCAYEVYMFTRVCICMFVHTCMETEVDRECFLLLLFTLVFETRFLSEPGILWLGDWLASKLQGSSCLYFPRVLFTGTCAWWPKPGPSCLCVKGSTAWAIFLVSREEL